VEPDGLLSGAAKWAAPLTGRARALLFIASLLMAAGALLHNGQELIAAGLGLSLFLLVERLVFTYTSAAAGKLVIRYSVERPLRDGGVTRVRIEVANPTRVPLEHVEYYDAPPPVLKPLRRPWAVLSLPPGSSARIEYPVRLVPGRHRWGQARLVVGDYLGLFRSERLVDAGLEVRVPPRPLAAGRSRAVITATPQPGGMASLRRRGVGTEFLGLREYMPGDEPRYIDWKSTARTGKLMVKVFSRESVMRVAIVVDGLGSMYRGFVGETKIEYSVRLAAALAEYLARRGDAYRLYFITSSGAVTYTPWLRGRASARQAAAFLAEHVEWPLGGAPASANKARSPWPRVLGRDRYETLARVLATTLPRGNAAVVVISDFSESSVRAKVFADSVEPLLSMHKLVYALIPVTVMFELERLHGLAAALYRVKQLSLLETYAEILKTLKSRGIKAVATGPSDLLDYILYRLERMRGVVS